MKLLMWLGAVIVIVAVLFVAAMGWLIWRVDRETARPIEIANADGTAGAALIVMSPGASSFPDEIAASFAQGLVRSGWRVERTTPSIETPTDLSGYDLVVVGSPIYRSAPTKPLRDWLSRLGDLKGKPVAILLTGMGSADEALVVTRQLVTDAKGEVAGAYAYFNLSPNDSENRYAGSNIERAHAMAADAAATLAGKLR
jgi:flavorubredoxin